MNVIGAFISDLHLSSTPPLLRSGEPDWYEAMSRPLKEIKAIQENHQCPIIYPGDIFHHWKETPELINWACQNLPHGYGIPGQHDLPHHRYSDIHRSAYWTLVLHGVIKNLTPGVMIGVGQLALYGFPWGYAIRQPQKSNGIAFNVAVVHKYIWTENCCIPNALETDYYGFIAKDNKGLSDYDCAFFGDNHLGFQQGKIFNCGTMMIRRSDELIHKPRIGLLLDDGTISVHNFDTSLDVYITTQAKKELTDIDARGFIESLNHLSGKLIDFPSAVKEYLKHHQQDQQVEERILQILEKSK